jgi:hypothetical protein
MLKEVEERKLIKLAKDEVLTLELLYNLYGATIKSKSSGIGMTFNYFTFFSMDSRIKIYSSVEWIMESLLRDNYLKVVTTEEEYFDILFEDHIKRTFLNQKFALGKLGEIVLEAGYLEQDEDLLYFVNRLEDKERERIRKEEKEKLIQTMPDLKSKILNSNSKKEIKNYLSSLDKLKYLEPKLIKSFMSELLNEVSDQNTLKVLKKELFKLNYGGLIAGGILAVFTIVLFLIN